MSSETAPEQGNTLPRQRPGKESIDRDPIAVSILVSTYNRAECLRGALEAMGRLCVPNDLPAELLVVDNASTDHTAEVVKTCRMPNMPVRHICEARRGKAHATNTALAEAAGDILLLTDDDVRPPQDWIEGMCRPIRDGRADAVAGGIRIAPHLERDWIRHLHRQWLASTHAFTETDFDLVGANMAFARAVLQRVPQFDPELDRGAYGTLGDHLFSRQLRAAGLRSIFNPAACVEHHFEESRLSRGSLLANARSAGRSSAYVAYHWEHRAGTRAGHYREAFRIGVALIGAYARRSAWHLRFGLGPRHLEGCPEWEFELTKNIAFHTQCAKEFTRSRQYRRFGLTKLDG